jgi:hypothetical protein
MKSFLRVCFVLIMAALLAVQMFSMPASGFAQGRGRGRGHYKKSEKFVNGHDARNGRWDGRGPRTGITGARVFDRQRRWHRVHLKHRAVRRWHRTVGR